MIFKITTDKDYKILSEYTGEWIETISEYDDLIFFAESEKDAKDMFKNQINVKRFPKQFTIEDITPPNDNKLHYVRGNEYMIYVILNGKQVMSWYDGSNTDYPEDLTWDREIGAVFDMGLRIGQMIKSDN